MNPIAIVLGNIISNPLTSVVGSPLLYAGLSAIFSELGAGKSLVEALTANNGQAILNVLSGFGLFVAKDGHK